MYALWGMKYTTLRGFYKRVQERSKSSGAWFKSQALRVLFDSTLFMDANSYMLHRFRTMVSFNVDRGLDCSESSRTAVAPRSSRWYIKQSACQSTREHPESHSAEISTKSELVLQNKWLSVCGHYQQWLNSSMKYQVKKTQNLRDIMTWKAQILTNELYLNNSPCC